MLLATTFLLLLVAFILQIIIWRIKTPVHSSSAILILFSLVMLTSILAYLLLLKPETTVAIQNSLRFALLFTTSTLVYIILYSAIEQQSPTLAIIHYISQLPNGCPDQSLKNAFSANNELHKRIISMVEGGWIIKANNAWHLTARGHRIAYLFEWASPLFGLNKGG